MKKFTFLLSLLLAFVGLTASAQDVRTWKKLASTPSVDNAVTDLSTLRDGGTYAFYNTNQKKYIKIDKYNDLHFGNASTLSADDDQAGLAVFKIHISTSGEQTVYSFETAIDGYYMPKVSDNNGSGGSCAEQTSTPATYVIQTTDTGRDQNGTTNTKTDGSFVIKNTSNDDGFDMTASQFCGWMACGSNCWYKIVPVTLSDETATYYKVTYNVKNGDNILSTNSEWLAEGATASYSPVTSYYYTLGSIENPIVSATNKVFDIAATVGEKPFSTDKNYALRINQQGTRYFEAINNSNTWNVDTKVSDFAASSFDVFGNKIWKFVESGYGVKIYNPYVGKYIKVNGGNAVTLENDGTELYFVQTGSNYALRTTTTNQYLNASIKVNEVANNRLGTWTENAISGGSTILIEDADASANIVAIGKTNLTSYFTENTSSTTADANKYLTCDNATRIETATTTADLFSIYYNPMNVSTTELYRIKSVGSADGNAYLTTDGMFVAKNGSLSTAYYNNVQVNGKSVDRNITRSTAEAAFGPQVWRFVKTGEGTYQLKNVNTRCNSAFFNGNNLDMPVLEGYGQSISVKPIAKDGGDNSYASIVWNGNYIGTRGDYYYGVNGNDASDVSNIWQIEKVTSIPVSISDAKYASVAYPFATQVTGDVKAYYASAAENGTLTLSEYADGIIPANEGAIIYNEGGTTTATLNVVSTENTVEGNLLKPATAKRAGFTAGETYVLAKNSSNEAAFLKSELTVVPANKAYIEATSLPTSSESQDALSFNFGGDVTGINAAVAADKANTEYYDLQGRRVLYPVHGIFVTNTGKKVLVK